MWPWPSKSCPLDPTTRRWLEHRWRWLTDEFGSDLLLDSLNVLPAPEFFPDEYDQSDEAAAALGNRVCDYMHVSQDLVHFAFYGQGNHPLLVDEKGHAIATGAAGTFSNDYRYIIRIERRQFARPMELVGTIAHELSHARLLGENRIDPENFDHELVTDLNVVFHGLGIFLANVPRNRPGDIRRWPGTQQIAPLCMTGAMFAYAMALRSCQRMEALPKWRKFLKPSIRAEFKQAYRFLDR